MKLQVAVEYMLIVGFALMVLLPYFLYSRDLSIRYSQENSLLDAKNSVEKLGQLADLVCSQGEPAQVVTSVVIPSNVERVVIQNKTIEFKVRTLAGTSDIFYTTTCNVSGNLSNIRGNIDVLIKAISDGVQIEVAS